MKRKIFATVMALVLCTTTLVGCGHKNDSSPAPADYVESDGPAITDGSDTGKNVTATPYTNEQGEILMQAPNDDIIGNEDFEQAPKEENASLDAESMEEEVLSETGEIEGIIVVQNYFYHADDGISNIFVYSIESINPDTGESTKIAEFSVRRPYNVTEYYPPWEPPVSRFRAIRKWYFPPSEPPQHIVAAHIFDFTINLLIVILGELLMQYHQIIYREVFLCLRRQKSEVFWNFWEKI